MCLPTVVAEFSRLVARLGLMDCAQLLPQRSQAMRAQRPLEMFFPFDPYLLRRSAQVWLLISLAFCQSSARPHLSFTQSGCRAYAQGWYAVA